MEIKSPEIAKTSGRLSRRLCRGIRGDTLTQVSQSTHGILLVLGCETWAKLSFKVDYKFTILVEGDQDAFHALFSLADSSQEFAGDFRQ